MLIKFMDEISRCLCGNESEIGCHGIRNGEIYSEHYCEGCFIRKRRSQGDGAKPLRRVYPGQVTTEVLAEIPMEKKKVNLPNKDAGRKLALRLKELGNQSPPKDILNLLTDFSENP